LSSSLKQIECIWREIRKVKREREIAMKYEREMKFGESEPK
jgi:hypothetical protein